jgi:hypothetical protein
MAKGLKAERNYSEFYCRPKVSSNKQIKAHKGPKESKIYMPHNRCCLTEQGEQIGKNQ